MVILRLSAPIFPPSGNRKRSIPSRNVPATGGLNPLGDAMVRGLPPPPPLMVSGGTPLLLSKGYSLSGPCRNAQVQRSQRGDVLRELLPQPSDGHVVLGRLDPHAGRDLGRGRPGAGLSKKTGRGDLSPALVLWIPAPFPPRTHRRHEPVPDLCGAQGDVWHICIAGKDACMNE